MEEPMGKKSEALKFCFSAKAKEGFTHVRMDESTAQAPAFSTEAGYGFVEATCATPPREVHRAFIQAETGGFVVTEAEFVAEHGFENENYNRYGMAFRIATPPGAYKITVKTTSELAVTDVSISGMHPQRIQGQGYWDSAELVPIRHTAQASGREWTYSFANGRSFLDIEIEPKELNTPVGVEEIVLEPISVKKREAGRLPALFTLGDSTVKSYIFDEAPMCGWGQVFGKLFDTSRLNVINYSMGGRSFKNTYWEGRFNDILLTGCAGDYVLIQFGHNDESQDEFRRFGRGNLEPSYEAYIREFYIPAVRAMGLVPVLVTPMSRVIGAMKLGETFTSSFTNRVFPSIMIRCAEELGVTLLDLHEESIRYYKQIGVEGALAIVMSLEAGETPGKTNDGSYANGHPANKIDGTHYKEALAKQFARIVATEIAKSAAAGNPVTAGIAEYLREPVQGAIVSGDWSDIHPELAKDTISGPGSYYRNQIEKLLQLGVLKKDEAGHFRPEEVMTVEEFTVALARLMGLHPAVLGGYAAAELTREVMGAILHAAYHACFTGKPRFMTDYNGTAAVPGSPEYDPNLDSGAKGIMYYPIVSFGQLEDAAAIEPAYAAKIREAYDLGLIRSERGLVRGKVMNGTAFEPKLTVTRAKAAKTLYFMWVLIQGVRMENDRTGLPAAAASRQ